MNYRVIIIPSLMYLASLGTYSAHRMATGELSTNITDTALSIVITYYQAAPIENISNELSLAIKYLDPANLTISLSLNVLLTLMIATRLIRHSRNIRNVLGPGTNSGLYKTVVTVMVESCVLYAIAFLIYIGCIAADSSAQNLFSPVIGNIQARVVFYHSFSRPQLTNHRGE